MTKCPDSEHQYIFPLFEGTYLIGTYATEELGRKALEALIIDENLEYQLEEHPLNTITTKFNTRVVASR